MHARAVPRPFRRRPWLALHGGRAWSPCSAPCVAGGEFLSSFFDCRAPSPVSTFSSGSRFLRLVEANPTETRVKESPLCSNGASLPIISKAKGPKYPRPPPLLGPQRGRGTSGSPHGLLLALGRVTPTRVSWKCQAST